MTLQKFCETHNLYEAVAAGYHYAQKFFPAAKIIKIDFYPPYRDDELEEASIKFVAETDMTVAVYHHSTGMVKSSNRFPDYRDRGHAKIQMAFFNTELPEARDFSVALKTLNNHRQEADYELTIEFNLQRGQAIVNLAHHTIAAFGGLDKTTLSEGILNYLQRTNQI